MQLEILLHLFAERNFDPGKVSIDHIQLVATTTDKIGSSFSDFFTSIALGSGQHSR